MVHKSDIVGRPGYYDTRASRAHAIEGGGVTPPIIIGDYRGIIGQLSPSTDGPLPSSLLRGLRAQRKPLSGRFPLGCIYTPMRRGVILRTAQTAGRIIFAQHDRRTDIDI